MYVLASLIKFLDYCIQFWNQYCLKVKVSFSELEPRF